MSARANVAPLRVWYRAMSTLRSLARDPLLMLAVGTLVTVIVCAVFADVVAPYDPSAQDLDKRLAPPFAPVEGVSVLGADALGRDMLSRIIYGSRVSLLVAVTAVLVAGTIGTALGLIAGYREGRWGTLIMRLADIQFSIPSLVLALAIVAVLGAGLVNMIIVLSIGAWVAYARVMRAQVLSVKEQDFVLASTVVGAPTRDIVLRHVYRNAAGVVAVIATIEMGHVMITEASLSFLGLGVPTGTPTWGVMIADGKNYLTSAWWVSTFPGVAILVTVLALNIVGDWLGDRANPVLREQ
jgi:peptide/nickel transport system permease protein